MASIKENVRKKTKRKWSEVTKDKDLKCTRKKRMRKKGSLSGNV